LLPALTVVFVTERLAAEHAALSVRGTAPRLAVGHLDRLAHRGQEAGDVCRFFHHARRHNSDSGSMSTTTVPSVYVFFRVMRTT